MPDDTTYNGWKNWQTWNVSLWIQNDEGLYNVARRFMRSYAGAQPWADMVGDGDLPMVTPDGAAMDDPQLCLSELDDMLREIDN